MTDNKLKPWLSRSSAIAQMGVGLGADIVDVVERMHGSISNKPLPWAADADDRTRGITSFVYKTIKGSFDASHLGLRKLAETLADPDDSNPTWLQVRAAINGVCGDALAMRGNPLVQPMAFVDAEPMVEEPDTLLLFIHGLCMHEAGWFDGVHQAQAKVLAERLNARVAYLRYNSGLHISENGEQLAKLLDSYAANEKRIVIIGHSMGGLLTRSACYYGGKQSAGWLNKLSHVVTLGTPHDGAPAERLGSWANSLLTYSPYTKPLARLGQIRSKGKQDLRHGCLRHDDWQALNNEEQATDIREPVPLLDKTEYLLVAGTRSEAVGDNPYACKHDLLVTVRSAWAANENRPEMVLQGDNVNRVLLTATDHMHLLWSCEVYDEIHAWLDDLEL